MKRSGIFVSTVFGGLCFVAFGLWGAFQCAVSWIGHASWICGGFFILFAPMGFVAGVLGVDIDDGYMAPRLGFGVYEREVDNG